MADERTQGRLYGEKEISTILKRASEIQKSESHGYAQGLSLPELRQVAADSGIDPRALEQAIAEIERGVEPGPHKRGFYGGPLTITRERTIGVEMTPDGWEQMAAAITRTIGTVGKTTRRDNTWEWTAEAGDKDLRTTQITVTSAKGKTSIRLFTDQSNLSVIAFLPTSILTFFGLLVVTLKTGMPLLLNVAVVAAAVAAVYLVTSMSFGFYSRKFEKKMDRLLADMERIATANPATQEVREEEPARETTSPLLTIPFPESESESQQEQSLTGERLRGM